MTAVLVSGATGYVGRFIVENFLGAGDDVTVMGRVSPQRAFFSKPVRWVAGALDADQDFSSAFDGADVFVHCAFSHAPGRYRGGEGDDPAGFRQANLDGSLALLEAAKRAGTHRVIFLSSRAVYGPMPQGTLLTEQTACAPDTLYGEIKLATETALAQMASASFDALIVRATGVYGPAGPGQRHKWTDLFADFAAGKCPAPRVGSEVHGGDLAAAIRLLANCSATELAPFGAAPIFNVSDILLDRRDLLAAYAAATGISNALPARADASAFNVMDCSRLRSMGWTARGRLDLTGLI